MGVDQRISSYVEHLPAALQEGPFLGRFLLAFEAILSGLSPLEGGDPASPPVAIEEHLDRMYKYFDPIGDLEAGGQDLLRAPEEFLPWLAQWVATSLRDDWDEATKRAFISKIAPLYRRRGTRSGLEEVLRICVGDVEVVDPEDGTTPAHFFRVILTVSERDPVLLTRRTRMVRAIVEREKPAHTIYGLSIRYPAMRINNDPTANPGLGKGLILGADPATDPERTTILGTTSYSES